MTTDDDVKRALARLGHEPVEQPNPVYLTALEQRLVQHHRALRPPAREVAAPARRAARPTRTGWRPRLATVGVLVALVLVAVTVTVAGRPDRAYALEQPVNVEVVRPDGSVVAGADGMRITAGSTVRVGPGGSVTIAGQRFGEGDVVRIERAGPQRVDDEPVPTSSGAPTATTGPPAPAGSSALVPETTVAPSSSVPSTTQAPVVSAPREAPPGTPVTTTPAVAPPPTEPRPAPTTAPPATTIATTTTTRRVSPITLSGVRSGADAATLSWTAVDGASTYVVVRTTAVGGATPPEPQYPVVAPTALVRSTADRGATDVVAAPVTAVRYRVVALDAGGALVGFSAFVQVEFPR